MSSALNFAPKKNCNIGKLFKISYLRKMFTNEIALLRKLCG